MNGRENFWEAVHEALDARRDPLEDPGVQRLAAEEPELLDELARLSDRLDAMQRRPARRPRRVAVAAALLVLAGGATWWSLAQRANEPQPAPDSAAATSAPAPGLAVLSFRSEAIEDGPDGRVTTRFDGLRTQRIREPRLSPSTGERDGALRWFAVIDSTPSSR